MDSTYVFENILKLIRSSNLNYHLEQTHFSAKISLKNSVIKDPTGAPLKLLLPELDLAKIKNLEKENHFLLEKLSSFEATVNGLTVDLNRVKSHRDASENQIKIFEANLERSAVEVLEHSDETARLKKSLNSLSEENTSLKN